VRSCGHTNKNETKTQDIIKQTWTNVAKTKSRNKTYVKQQHGHAKSLAYTHSMFSVPGFTRLGGAKPTKTSKRVLGKRKDPQSMPKKTFELKAPTFTFISAVNMNTTKQMIQNKDTIEKTRDIQEFDKAFGEQTPKEKKGIPSSKNPFQGLEDSSDDDEEELKEKYRLAAPTFAFGDDQTTTTDKEEEEEEEDITLDTSDLKMSAPIFEVISTKKKKKKNKKRGKRGGNRRK
jgi:hypothetical protein